MFAQIGRAGRDGELSWCHLLLNEQDARRSYTLSFSDDCSILQVQVLFARILGPHAAVAAMNNLFRRKEFAAVPSRKLFLSVDMQEVADGADVRPESIETLLSYAEKLGLLSLMPAHYGEVEVTIMKDSIRKACGNSPALAAAVEISETMLSLQEASAGSKFWIESNGENSAFLC